MRQATSVDSNTISVRIQMAGLAPATYNLPVDATVEDAFVAAGYPLDTKASVSGVMAELEDILDDGDTLLIERRGDKQGC